MEARILGRRFKNGNTRYYWQGRPTDLVRISEEMELRISELPWKLELVSRDSNRWAYYRRVDVGALGA